MLFVTITIALVAACDVACIRAIRRTRRAERVLRARLVRVDAEVVDVERFDVHTPDGVVSTDTYPTVRMTLQDGTQVIARAERPISNRLRRAVRSLEYAIDSGSDRVPPPVYALPLQRSGEAAWWAIMGMVSVPASVGLVLRATS